MIDAIDLALKRLLEDQLKRPVVGQTVKEVAISFEPPKALGDDDEIPRINLYLHEVTENVKLRNDPFQISREPGKSVATRKRSKVHVDLCYVLTVHAKEPTLEHRLLTLALAALLRNPTIPPRFLEGSAFETEATLKVAQPAGESGEHGHMALWQSIGGPLRAALSLRVTASFDPFETEDVKVVREMLVGLGFKHEGQLEGRPNQVRSYRVSVAGIILDRDQQPLAGATVSVVNHQQTAVSDDRGFFYLTNLPSGPQVLLIHRRGYRGTEVRCEVPPPGLSNEAETILAHLDRLSAAEDSVGEGALFDAPAGRAVYDAERTYPTTIAGKLFLEDGRPAAYVPVRLQRSTRHAGDSEGPGLRTVTDLEGRYHFTTFEDGETVWATYPGLGEVEVQVKNGAGKLPSNIAGASS